MYTIQVLNSNYIVYEHIVDQKKKNLHFVYYVILNLGLNAPNYVSYFRKAMNKRPYIVQAHHYMYTSAFKVYVNRTATKRLHSVQRNSISQVSTASTTRVEDETSMKRANAVHDLIP